MSGSQISTVAGLYAHCGARMLPVYKHSSHFCDSLLPKRHRRGEIDVKFQQLSRFLRSMHCLGSGAKIGASSFTRGGCARFIAGATIWLTGSRSRLFLGKSIDTSCTTPYITGGVCRSQRAREVEGPTFSKLVLSRSRLGGGLQ